MTILHAFPCNDIAREENIARAWIIDESSAKVTTLLFAKGFVRAQ